MTESEMEMKSLTVGTLKIEIHPNSKAAGQAAARATAQALQQLDALRETIGVIFATGASQLNTLHALNAIEGLPWHKVRGFHMDEYIGIPADHPSSFRRYLRENLPQQMQMKEFSAIDGTAPNPQQECRDYAEKVRSADPQLCLFGVGENGHLAFNDPAEADFNDPLDMKIVHLDTICRQQQAAEGWFNTYQEVPERAITLTIPTLFRVPKLIAIVPGSRKADIIRRTLEEPISTTCPATILRTHPDATLYLDIESAAHLAR
ncbi:glucosamine-6-phosphate deaminase [Edaphobacter aggregans]|uniref:glucosamine-6-phosphate deaminase n=1 Tax=Edaphobacter aggregans TaxID=570835 RepID=UPI00068F877F|nr:glucosamine-6-phosphate deaminase [Edaphobacter aggregans]